jgi:hypothetical protein
MIDQEKLDRLSEELAENIKIKNHITSFILITYLMSLN